MASPSPATAQVLVVDDEPDLRTLYELTLLREGYRVDAASSLAEAWNLLDGRRFDAVITDMRLPDGLGLELLQRMAQQQRAERCIVMTAYGSAENAVEALKAGAFDYLTKPVDLKQFRTVVASAVADAGGARLRAPAPAAARSGNGERPLQGQAALQRLVGESASMCAVKERIAKVARSMAPVMVRGESGTGKELVARAIHGCSHRADGPFVAVNCSAIPETLLEAEFFGAKKGSYTGAAADREGYFQAARGGTLFLDEIGDLPLPMQSKLLRAIQERQVRSLGSIQEDAVDVRIVSATHRDLGSEVAGGRFRQDLFYRLNVIDIMVPPLRERREDLPALCEALIARIAQESGMPAPKLAPQMLAQLDAHPLPGNVRELENLLHRAVALADGDELHMDFAPAQLPQAAASPSAPAAERAAAPPPLPGDLQAWLDQQEREILVRALQETGFNRTAAAQRLGLSLRQIRYRIARLQIAVPGSDNSMDNGVEDADDAAG
jgi:two-component system response regulator PilR (NtrC family)